MDFIVNSFTKSKRLLRNITLYVMLILICFIVQKEDVFQLNTYLWIMDGNTPLVSFWYNTAISEILENNNSDNPIAFIQFTVCNDVAVSKVKYIRIIDHYKLINVNVDSIYYKDEIFKITANKKIIYAALCNFVSDYKFNFNKNDNYLAVIINKTNDDKFISHKFDVFCALGGRSMAYKISADGKYIYAESGNFDSFAKVSIPLSDEEKDRKYRFKAEKDAFIEEMLEHINKYRY